MAGILQRSAGCPAEAIGEEDARGFQSLLTESGLDDCQPIGKIRVGFEEGLVVAFESP